MLENVRRMVLAEVDAKVLERTQVMRLEAQKILQQMAQKQKEKTDKLTEEINRCQVRQATLEAENEKLREQLAGLSHKFVILGHVLGGAGAQSPDTAAAFAALAGAAGCAAPPASGGVAPSTPPKFAGDSAAMKLPPVPPMPFESPAGAATTFSLADALGATERGSIATSAPAPRTLSLASSLSSTPARPVVGERLSGSRVTQSPPNASNGSATPYTFSFTLRKADGAELGLDVSHSEVENALCVDGIRPDGAVEAWNRQCGSAAGSGVDRAVRRGDKLISVNGIKGPPQAMLDECRDKRLLKLEVVRCSPGEAPRGSPLRAEASEFVPMVVGSTLVSSTANGGRESPPETLPPEQPSSGSDTAASKNPEKTPERPAAVASSSA